MIDFLERLSNATDGMAALVGYPHAQRKSAWLERLAVNLPELRMFESVWPDVEAGYLSPAVAEIHPGGMSVTGDTPGVAAVARQAHATPQRIADAALGARSAARQVDELHAFTWLADEASLRQQAAAAATRLQAGEALPLLGVPVAVKDLMAVRGWRQSNGTGGDRQAAAPDDAAAVARLRQAGALIIGTTNLHELAYGITSDNPHHGRVHNPRAPGYTPGGSSGGSAAAVAAGVVRLAVGTDTAGSIRVPASCCGVVGFKPSFDAVPRAGVQSLGTSLDHLGPIAATVADAALGFSVLAGLPARTARRAPLKNVRVGVPRNYFFDPLSDDVSRAMQAVLARMRDDGAQLVEIDLHGVEQCAALQFITLCSEATDLHWQRLLGQPDTLGADVRVRLEIGQFLPAIWYVRAQRARAELACMFDAALRELDVIVTPTMRVEPPPAGSASALIRGNQLPLHTAVTALTMPFNLTGMPALTLPCGVGDNAAPLGVQVAGRRGDDWRVLDVGARLEDLLDSAP